MADKATKQLPGTWQNTLPRPDNPIVDSLVHSATNLDNPTTSISHSPSAELRQHDVHTTTDVTPAIKRIRQLHEEVLLEKRGTTPRDERHKELEERLASLEKEDQVPLHREERERQTDEFIMKTLEEERLLREYVQRHPPSIVPPTWEERMRMAEARNNNPIPTDHTIVRQAQPFSEAQVIMSALAQLSKDLTSQMNQLGSHLEQAKSQVGHLSSCIDDIEISSNRSRSRSRSHHSLQHPPMTSDSPRFYGLPTTVEDIEDEIDDSSPRLHE